MRNRGFDIADSAAADLMAGWRSYAVSTKRTATKTTKTV